MRRKTRAVIVTLQQEMIDADTGKFIHWTTTSYELVPESWEVTLGEEQAVAYIVDQSLKEAGAKYPIKISGWVKG